MLLPLETFLKGTTEPESLLSASTYCSIPQGYFGSFKIGNISSVYLFQKRIHHKNTCTWIERWFWLLCCIWFMQSSYPIHITPGNNFWEQCLSKADLKSVIKTFASTTYLYSAHLFRIQKHGSYSTRHQLSFQMCILPQNLKKKKK